MSDEIKELGDGIQPADQAGEPAQWPRSLAEALEIVCCATVEGLRRGEGPEFYMGWLYAFTVEYVTTANRERQRLGLSLH